MYQYHINSVHVEVTDRCNAECPACPRSFGGGSVMPYVKNEELSLDYFKLIGDDFCSKINKWNFCGTKGDPSSAQDLFPILEYLLECNPNTNIDIRTNGGARNENFWKRVGDLFLNTNCRVVWSIDGLEETNHIYRKNVKWKKLYKNLMTYIRTGAKSQWEFSHFAHNDKDIPVVEFFCKKHNIELIIREPFGFETHTDQEGIFTKHKTMGVYEKDESDPNNSILSYEIRPYGVDENLIVEGTNTKTWNIGNYKPGVYDKEVWKDVGKQDIDIDCKVSSTQWDHEIYIDSSGLILPCCYIASKYMMGDEQLLEMFEPYVDELLVTNQRSIYDVLNHNVFVKTMPKAMEGTLEDGVGYCVTCIQHCKKR